LPPIKIYESGLVYVSHAPRYFIGIYRSDFSFVRRAGVVRDAFAMPEGCARSSSPSRLFTTENGSGRRWLPRREQSRSARSRWRVRQILPARRRRRPFSCSL